MQTLLKRKIVCQCVLGCNILRDMQRSLQDEWGSSFRERIFANPKTVEERKLVHVIAIFQDGDNTHAVSSKVCVCSRKPLLVPANTVSRI